MAKINHYSNLDIVQNLLTDAKNRGILHQRVDKGNVLGKHIDIQGRRLLNFGTCGYMALEKHPKVISSAIEYLTEYGLQYSLSRAYASTNINEDLEIKLTKIYDSPVIVYSSTSQAHISVIPILVGSNDLVILDQQVHISVQTAVQLLRQKGVQIDMIRHSNLEMLEKYIEDNCTKYNKIWYMIDGVYSMFGDTAPIHNIFSLLEKHKQLYIYVDDAHGMSWAGKHGCGYIFGEVGIHKKMILTTTLAKGFGAIGGLTVFPNNETFEKVRIWGGPLTYSHPLSPPLIGAAHALADIHLSPEIIEYQNDLKNKIEYCHKLLAAADLPVLSQENIPIKFIGAGQPNTGFVFLKGMLDDGFFVNIGIFPGVPIKNTGIRFTITRHVEYEDINKLVEAVKRNYNKALAIEGVTNESVRKAFKLSIIEQEKKKFMCNVYTSITDIDKNEWNEIFEDVGNFDYEGMEFIENSYKNNTKIEDVLKFFYIINKDCNGVIQSATVLTSSIQKDDFLSHNTISDKIEDIRKNDPYYLCSKTIATGCMLTIGNHVYINRKNEKWRDYLKELLHDIEIIRENENANNISLRDFPKDDEDLNTFFIENGFIQIELPYLNLVDISRWNTTSDFYSLLSKNSKRHFKKDVERYYDDYIVSIKSELTNEEINHAHELFLNVYNKNSAINIFPYPKSVLVHMNNSRKWEFIVLYLKDNPSLPVSYCMVFLGKKSYMPIFMGLDYSIIQKPYNQNLYRVLIRAKELGYSSVNLGLSAVTEKRKFGAYQQDICMYSQTIDNFNQETISTMGH